MGVGCELTRGRGRRGPKAGGDGCGRNRSGDGGPRQVRTNCEGGRLCALPVGGRRSAPRGRRWVVLVLGSLSRSFLSRAALSSMSDV